METKFTKGEWEIAHDDKIGVFITNPKEWGRICTIRTEREPNWEANAKLIAAAPELLDALMNMKELYGGRDGYIEPYKSAIEKINKAIEKATK